MAESGSKATPLLRAAALADAPAILEVLQGAFPRWPAFEIGVPALEHLKWKLGGPRGDAAGEHGVVTVGEQVVGARLRWLGRVWVGGIEYPSGGGADVAIDPAWQGRGIGRVLTKGRDREVAAADRVWVRTPSRSAQLLHMNDLLDHILRPLGVWTRPLTVRGLVGSQLRDRSV